MGTGGTGGKGPPITLLVASGGGHLRQLHRLEPRLRGVPEDRVWVTYDSPQTRSLLATAKHVHCAQPVAPRDYRSVLFNMRMAARILRKYDVGALVSTGSGLALSYFPLARALGVPCHYVESAARIDGPSLTGRVITRLPGVKLYTQHERWSDRRWRYRGDVIDGLSAESRPIERRPLRVTVTLGTIPYAFERLTRQLTSILPDDAEVYWQTGSTDPAGLPGRAARVVPHAELVEAMRSADVVVSHAGVGSALDALDAGRSPILVPRQARHGEHIDDHQEQIADLLSRRGLALSLPPEQLTMHHLGQAGGRFVRPSDRPARFELG